MTDSSNTETLAGIAKEIYPVEEIAAMEQTMTTFWKEIPEGKGLEYSPLDGGKFKFPVKASGPHGQKMMNEREGLPNPRSSRVVQGESYIKEYAGVLQFTKRELELAKKSPQAFATAKTFEMANLIENAYKYFNRQVANGNGTGVITTVTVAGSGVPELTVADATPFQINMVCDIFNAAGTKIFSEVVVEDIDYLTDPDAHVVTFDQDITSAVDVDSKIYIAGVNDNAATDGKEMIGLPLVYDDGSEYAEFQGIVRSGANEVPNYRGITVDADGAPLSPQLINQLMTRAKRIGGVDFEGSSDAYWLFSPEQWRVYASLAIPLVRYMPSDSPDQNKMISQKECAGKRVVEDTDVSRNAITIIKKSTALEKAMPVPLDWESDLGGTSLKWLSGSLQGVMVLYALAQMFSRKPRDLAAVTNLETVAI